MTMFVLDSEPACDQLWIPSDPSTTFLRDRNATDEHRWIRQPHGDAFTWTQVLARYGRVTDEDPDDVTWIGTLPVQASGINIHDADGRFIVAAGGTSGSGRRLASLIARLINAHATRQAMED